MFELLGGGILGGVFGGWIYGHYGAGHVFLLCAVAALSWMLVSLTMKAPSYLANLLISLETIAKKDEDLFVADLFQVSGVAAVTLHFEERVAYLKVDNQKLEKEQLQNLLSKWSNDRSGRINS